MGTQDPLWAHRLLIDACLKHRVPFFWRGPGTMLIAGTGIADVLRAVLAGGSAQLLGLEGFQLEGSAIRPRLDLIFDVQRDPSRDPFAVIASWGDSVWIDATLETSAELA
jgi:hypothetical protein